MHGRFKLTAASLLALVLSSASFSAENWSQPPDAYFSQIAGELGTTDEAIYDHGTLANNEVEWIASKTGWKEISVPVIKRTSKEKLSNLFFGFPEGIDGARPLALYAKGEHVLYLSYEINLGTVLGRSILLHELVHHLQRVNDVHFECPEATEAQAYQLQSQWLHEQGVKDPWSLIGFSEMELNSLGCF